MNTTPTKRAARPLPVVRIICKLCQADGSEASFTQAGSLCCPDCGQRSYFDVEVLP